MNLNDYSDECHYDSVAAGWWDNSQDTKGDYDPHILATKLCLVHSEVSEALEGLRKGGKDDHLPQYDQEDVEIVDALIRLFDYAGARGIDLEAIYQEKREYNKKRADHKPENRALKGGKKF